MQSLRTLIRDLDRRFAAAVVLAPLAACGGTTNPNDGGEDGPVFFDGPSCPPPQTTTITYQACADASADASDADVDGGQCFSGCEEACRARGIATACTERGEDGGLRIGQCMTQCLGGRRPAGLREENATQGVAGWLARAAWFEAASVHAFVRLAHELEAHDAPHWMIREAKRAARDEVHHAKAMATLARKRGGRVARARVRARAVRSLEAIARENAVEGCVRETYAALVARWQSQHATSRDVRAVMTDIASDERRHAALSLAVDTWLKRRLSPRAAARVERARLRAEVELMTPRSEIASTALGLPDAAQQSALAKALFA